MYQVSENFKNKVYDDSTRHLLKIYIGEKQIESKYILGFKKMSELFYNDEFCFGTTPAQQIELKIYKDALPDEYERIYVETGIDDEIIPLGYFNLDKIEKNDDRTITITATDDMIKFEFNYDGSKLKYPATLKEVLKDICNKAGVELRFYFFFK